MGVDAIARVIGLHGHSVGRRMVELQRSGAVELTGDNVASDSGRLQREWRRRV
jgi:predicted ArsR family transcriptional regulator